MDVAGWTIFSERGVPLPWRVEPLVHNRIGRPEVLAVLSRATILRELMGSIRGSLAPARSSAAG
ncbi:MAG TPA: hypothetical protein PLS53_00900 [Thermoanaerobaculaceae bacterium]|nr:hypothetical protein [Thermoanaerobaculaceae bacterium]HPS76692.1 hypothetical protein [Thermoanaerobaculaceae bacterium]